MKHLLRLSAFRISVVTTVGCLVLYLATAQISLMRTLETRLLDVRLQLRGAVRLDSPVVLITIDDRSIVELGRWPWNRQHFANITQQLHAAGARVIVFDILFTEAELHPERAIWEAVQRQVASLPVPATDPTWQALRQQLVGITQAPEPDERLAAAMQQAGNVALAFSFMLTPEPSLPALASPLPAAFATKSAYRTLRYLGTDSPALPLYAVGTLLPIPPLRQAAQALGHVNVVFDTDGAPRYDYPVLPYGEAYYVSLPLQAARLYRGLRLEDITVHFGRGIQLGADFIATDEAMRLLVNYYGPPGTFPTYAFVDVLRGQVPPQTFRDKIVLIGGGAVGLGDTFVTPFSAALRGVERQATVITNLLHGDGLRRRQSTAWLDLASMVLVGLGLGWLNRSCAWLGGSLLALGFAAGYTVANVLLLTQARLWLSLLFPLLTIVATHGAMTLYKFRTESRQKQLIRQAFQHYLHPAMVDEVAQHPETLHLGGEQKTLTVLFSDVRSFSTLSERLTPEALVALLNEYFTAMTDLVLTHNGMLDKYIGDAVMAIYGAPLAAPDHAYQACCTALRMLHTLQTTLRSGWQARALPVLDIRIGINTGPMVVGNMGSTVRFDYTVMGDEVNLGARLEGVNKIYGTRVIVSATTWEQVGDRLVTRELDIIRVQGKSHPTRIFEVMAFPPLAPPLAMLVQRFAEGLAAYRARLWDEAADCFRAALCLVPDDGPSQLYLERCEQFRCNPPPADWDGIYDMQSK